MAKLKAPLMSLGAAGQLGKSIVFFPWKGLDCVREYVIPSNPNTTAQQTQRAYMTAAVAAFHAALYTALDMTGWNRLAGVLAGAMSGFNAMIRYHIAEDKAGGTWEEVKDMLTSGVGAAGFGVQVDKVSGGNAPTVHYGTTKTFMPNTSVMADQGGNVWAVALAGLSGDTLYYFYIDCGAAGVDYGRTGIYQQRTT